MISRDDNNILSLGLSSFKKFDSFSSPSSSSPLPQTAALGKQTQMVSKLNLKARFTSFAFVLLAVASLYIFPSLGISVCALVAAWALYEFMSTIEKSFQFFDSTLLRLNCGFCFFAVFFQAYYPKLTTPLFTAYFSGFIIYILYLAVLAEKESKVAIDKDTTVSSASTSTPLFSFLPSTTTFTYISLCAFAHLWITIPMTYAVALLTSTSGYTAVLFPIFTVAVGENGGLFIGYACGKSVPFPSLSPKKTYEGYLAQISTSVITSVVYSTYASFFAQETSLRLIHALVLGVILGIFGIAGDLFESFFKRSLGLKDVANTLPGWGGILDRIDGLLFAFPITYAYLALFVPEYL